MALFLLEDLQLSDIPSLYPDLSAVCPLFYSYIFRDEAVPLFLLEDIQLSHIPSLHPDFSLRVVPALLILYFQG